MAIRFDRLRDELASRIAAIPEFRAKLADSQLDLDYPVWVEDEEFDLDRHLLRIGLPSPGGRQELVEICGHLASEPLDRSRPLWEMWVIEGVADTDPCEGGLLAVMTKVHHAAVDGVTGANLFSELCTVEPGVRRREPVEGAGSAGPLQIAASGLMPFAFRPWQLANVLPTTVATVVKTLGRARGGLHMAAPFAGPPTRFNASVTAGRNVALAQLDLDDIKKVKDRFQVTVNDVVMALCASVLRWFLSDHDGLPAKSLVAMVPVSVHEKSDRPGHNQLSGMFCSLETHIGTRRNNCGRSAQADAAAKNHRRRSVRRCCRTGRNSPPGRYSGRCFGSSRTRR